MTTPASQEVYTHPVECPRCGQGSKTLKPESLPLVFREFGSNKILMCQICFRQWIVRTVPDGEACGECFDVHACQEWPCYCDCHQPRGSFPPQRTA